MKAPPKLAEKAAPPAKPAAKAPGTAKPVLKASGSKANGAKATPAAPPPATAPTGAATKPSKKSAKASTPAPTTPAAPPKPRTFPKGGPAKADLKRYREALLARRRELLSSSKELAAEALQAGGGDFSVDHMADHGSDNYEQDFNLKLLEGEAGQLADIRDALAKLDGKGELPFGLCEGCADEPQGRCPTCPWIPASRLDAIPHARLCVQMKEREEARG
ncbi:MAG: TraR/DksA family transcriptional regulator [Planctomycetia bacterium]|nr:TraR/DksA family transcriptional regulator [Planctomycetia bacterium]